MNFPAAESQVGHSDKKQLPVPKTGSFAKLAYVPHFSLVAKFHPHSAIPAVIS